MLLLSPLLEMTANEFVFISSLNRDYILDLLVSELTR